MLHIYPQKLSFGNITCSLCQKSLNIKMKTVTAGANTTVNRFVQPLFTYVYLCFQFYVLCDDLSSFLPRIIRFKKYMGECIAELDCRLQGLIFGK